MQANEPEYVTVDIRTLADLRSRLLTAEDAASTASGTVERLEDRILKAEEEIARLKLEAEEEIARLNFEIEDVQNEVKRRTASESELSEALRIAQNAAWESNRDWLAAEAQLKLARSEVEGLTSQIGRINNSKAWKAVSAYRKGIKRLRGSR